MLLSSYDSFAEIIQPGPKRRQTLLFSHLPAFRSTAIAGRFLQAPERVSSEEGPSPEPDRHASTSHPGERLQAVVPTARSGKRPQTLQLPSAITRSSFPGLLKHCKRTKSVR